MPGAQPAVALTTLDAAGFLRWAALVRSSFAARRAEIDALNVFPVPDGDTGTNLYLTLDAAIDQARAALERLLPTGTDATLGQLCREMSRAMLLTARGNSGVILSQLFRGVAEHVQQAAAEALDGAGLAQALQAADRLAWAAVTLPQEGTILSVSRAAAHACAGLLDTDAKPTLATVVTTATAAAARALEHTPAQLPVLARAGVVDAGGAGYVLFLEGLHRVVVGAPFTPDHPMRRRAGWTRAAQAPAPGPWVPGRSGGLPAPSTDEPPTDEPPTDEPPKDEPPTQGHAISAHPQGSRDAGPGRVGDFDGPAYEVMYLLADTDETRVEQLRRRLAGLGDSLIVVGAEGTWNVHVHVGDPGAAIEAGIEAGRPHRVVVTHFQAECAAQRAARVDPAALAVVACAAGAGIAEVLRAAGATVVTSGPGQRASSGQLLEAVHMTRSGRVLVLPNDADTELAAHAAARAATDEGYAVRVVRSARTAVQGVAALAVFDPRAGLEDNHEAMTQAAAATRHGAVTVARKAALTAAGWCQEGDVLGAVAGEFVIIGEDLYDVAGQVVQRLLGEGGELLTVISGQDAPADLSAAVTAAARIRHRDLEVTTIPGLQPLYTLLVGVE